MKNTVQRGDVLTLPAPYAVASGAGMLVGALFAVATAAAAQGVDVEAVTTGVYDLAALSTDTGSYGTKVYWDDTNKRCTVTSTSNTLIGALVGPKTAGQATMRVRLNGTV